MQQETRSSLRKALLFLTTAVAASAVLVSLPVKKVLAAAADFNTGRSSIAHQQPVRSIVVQPVRVNPSAVKLLEIADQALSDSALRERIFREPDAVASKYQLSNNEKLVLRQMTAEQFQTAHADAARVAATRLMQAGPANRPTEAEINFIAGRMVVGRSILGAVGRSYLNAADAHDCCPWNKAIQLGVNSDPAAYESVFRR